MTGRKISVFRDRHQPPRGWFVTWPTPLGLAVGRHETWAEAMGAAADVVGQHVREQLEAMEPQGLPS